MLADKAYEELFPGKDKTHVFRLKYSKAFKGYNANVKYNKQTMEFRLSHNWENISNEIKIGLIQSLLNKVFNTKNNTLNIDLYKTFLKKIPLVTAKTHTDPVLDSSFERVNDKYFYGMILKPNLVWGGSNLRTLGTYDYTADTIRISKILEKDTQLLDYVMYHEMLHKKLKYKERNNRNMHHTVEFKEKEKEFDDPNIEKKLSIFLKKHRIEKYFKIF